MNSDAAVSIAAPRVARDTFLPCTILFVVLVTTVGGAARQGLWSDAIVQVAALPLLVWSLIRLPRVALGVHGRWALVLLAATVALPLLQLIPLSPALWTRLPGRENIAAAYAAAGVPLPWLPISLDPAATQFALLSLIPGVTVYLATLPLTASERRTVVGAMVAVAFVSVGLDVLQMMGGTGSALRFYAITNPDRAVGFFANGNHNAAFLYALAPFVAAWMIGLTHDHRNDNVARLAVLSIVMAAVVIGVVTTHSRAGLTLLFVAGLSAALLAWRHGRGRSKRRLLYIALGANAAALLIAFQFGFVGFVHRAEQSDIIDDVRWPVAAVTAKAALSNMPFGTGFGTFVPVYESYAPRTLVRDRYVNHAHDDWLELWLTGGVPALMVALGFVVWLGAATVSLWRVGGAGNSAQEAAFVRAAPITIMLLLAHSVLDYPLRSAAVTAVLAIACVIATPLPSPSAGSRREPVDH